MIATAVAEEDRISSAISGAHSGRRVKPLLSETRRPFAGLSSTAADCRSEQRNVGGSRHFGYFVAVDKVTRLPVREPA